MADDAQLQVGQALGPYDIATLDTTADTLINSHLDLGSVLVPVVEGGQVTVEMSPDHEPAAVYLVTPHGRVSVTVFAAPKSPGLWREVVRELAESLRDEGASTSVEDGHWGREVLAEVPGGSHRFIGVDGPRWMVRCVASGPPETADALAQLARAVLAESVVRRGSEPIPPREMLPLVLPPVLAEQVAAAQQQMFGDGSDVADAAEARPTGRHAAGRTSLNDDPPAYSAPSSDTPGGGADNGGTQGFGTQGFGTQSGGAQSGGAQNGDAHYPYGRDGIEQVSGGALDQIAQATVLADDDPADTDDTFVDDAEFAEDLTPPSEGSAMQRLRGRFAR